MRYRIWLGLILAPSSLCCVAIKHDFSMPAFNAPALKVKTKQKTAMSAQMARKMPVWPTFGRFPEKGDLTTGEVSFEWGSWCFTSTGDQQDASCLMVGEDAVTIGDVVLIARLLADGKIAAGSGSTVAAGSGQWRRVSGPAGEVKQKAKTRNLLEKIGDARVLTFPATGNSVATHYLSKLAPKGFAFDSISKELSFNASYSRSFYDQLCCLTIEMPVKLRITKMDMTRRLSDEENVVLRNALGDEFFDLYPAGLPDFYEDLLYRKGMVNDTRNLRLGLGDISLTLNRRLESDHWDFGVVGLGLVMPTSRDPDRSYIWPAELGDEGFWSLRAHTGFAWRYWRFFNPHVFVSGRFRFLTLLDRRVSEVIYGEEDAGVPRHLPFVDSECYFSEKVVEKESNVSAFAQSINSVEYRKGQQVNIRFGSIMDDIFLKDTYLDIFYEFMGKFEDKLGFKYEDVHQDGAALMRRTEQVAHRLGFSYVYQHNDHMRIEVGGSHVFAGQSVLKTFDVRGGLQFNF